MAELSDMGYYRHASLGWTFLALSVEDARSQLEVRADAASPLVVNGAMTRIGPPQRDPDWVWLAERARNLGLTEESKLARSRVVYPDLIYSRVITTSRSAEKRQTRVIRSTGLLRRALESADTVLLEQKSDGFILATVEVISNVERIYYLATTTSADRLFVSDCWSRYQQLRRECRSADPILLSYIDFFVAKHEAFIAQNPADDKDRYSEDCHDHTTST